MEQTKQDLENIKSKLFEHIKSNYPEEKAEEYVENINSMDDKQFLEFLKQQGLLNSDGTSPQKNQCIFCSIVFEDIPSTKIGENKKAIAILDLNSISQGHTLIIPKEHLDSEEKFPSEIKTLADSISQNIKNAFNPKRIDQIPGNVMGHQVINLIPIYENETIESGRKKETPESLAEIKKKIEEAKPEQIEKLKPVEIIKEGPANLEEINEKNTWLPKRIP